MSQWRRRLISVLVVLAGAALLGLGVAGLILPVLPGWLFVVPGLALLGLQVPICRRILAAALRRPPIRRGFERSLRFPPIRAVVARLDRQRPVTVERGSWR